MPLSRLENFLVNTDGNILYVNPSDLDATDSFDNKGNSLTRPFVTIQRALIESARLTQNKYFAITPEIHKMWDYTWDEITNKEYMNIPYKKWNETDIFDIRHNLKSSSSDMFLEPTLKSKWAIWFDIYNKAFYEDLCPVHDDWIGYGPWDWYSNILSEHVKTLGVDFQQYVLRGQTIFEYSIGDWKNRDITSSYKDFLKIKAGAKEQRDNFEAKMQEYLSKGIKMLQTKNII